MRRLAALGFVALSSSLAACAATGSDSEVHGPVFSIDAATGSDAGALAPDASSAPPDAAALDASVALDAGATDGAPPPSAEASLDDAADDAPGADASDGSAPPVDAAAAACAGFNPATNPIVGTSAVSGTTTVDLNLNTGTGNFDNGTAAANQPVTITAWTSPVGVMQTIYAAYALDGGAGYTQVPLVRIRLGDAGAGEEAWTGQFPGEASGTTVAWYLAGTDYCTATVQYYSNLSKNFHYTAQ